MEGEYRIDITKIHGDGEFPCPECNVLIVPDDETEEIYRIVQTVIKNGELEELVLQCKSCGAKIRLVGFMSPNEASEGFGWKG